MIIGNWFVNKTAADERTNAEVSVNGKIADISFREGYSIASVSFTISDFEPDKYIRTEITVKNGKCKKDIYAQWLKDETEIFKEYIEADSPIRPYPDADKLNIIVFFRSNGKDDAVVTINSVTQEEKILKRSAKVSSLCIPYGFVYEHSTRKCSENLKETLSKIDGLYNNDKPDIIVLTENFYSRNCSDDYLSASLKLDSPEIYSLRKKAEEHKVYIACAFREEDSGNLYNTAILIDRNGEIAAYYRKTHLTMNEKQKGLIPGEEIVVADIDFGKVGFAICWDLYYPDFVRTLVKKGAEIIINPSAGYNEKMHTMRALDNGVYIVTAGVYGNSTVVISPDGEVISNGIMSGAAVADIDLNKRYPVRYLSCGSHAERGNVYFYESREDLYL